jgi:hypothetical protein
MIDLQDVRAGAELAQRVVFSPWNCLLAHEPVGIINLARRAVYDRLSEQRHPPRRACRAGRPVRPMADLVQRAAR